MNVLQLMHWAKVLGGAALAILALLLTALLLLDLYVSRIAKEIRRGREGED